MSAFRIEGQRRLRQPAALSQLAVKKVRVSGAALLALAAVYFFDSGRMLEIVAFAAAVHELGHYLASKLLGLRLCEFNIELWGLHMRFDGVLSYRDDLLTAAAGPLASLLLALASAAAGRYAGWQDAYLLAGVSFLFGLFNLLPVFPLDGGRIVCAASATLWGPVTADAVGAVCACTVIFALLVGGMVVLLRTKVNFSLLLVAVWLLFSYCQKSGLGIKSIMNWKKEVGSVK